MHRLFTINKVAEMMSKHPRTIRRWIDQGDMGHYKNKKTGIIYISERHLEKFISENFEERESISGTIKEILESVS